MATGIPCSADVGTQFEQMKLRSKSTFLVMKIVEDEVQVVETGTDKGENGGVQPFMEWLGEDERLNECCYAVIDVAFTTDDDRPTSKLVFVSWVPDTSKIREKMKYSGTKDAVLANLQGAAIKLNATDISELGAEGEEIIAKAKTFA
mmetsp:Transcript_1350/g.5796  ORF Transcript_1350/g.5796 Transcript_1350/m.5796 type:complete len:147 (+) Transcript_1350:894-1334(+)